MRAVSAASVRLDRARAPIHVITTPVLPLDRGRDQTHTRAGRPPARTPPARARPLRSHAVFRVRIFAALPSHMPCEPRGALGTLSRGRMRCHNCGSVITGAPEVCPRCRTPFDDSHSTLAWSAAEAEQAQFDAELIAVRRTRRLVVVAVVGGMLALSAVAVAGVLLWSRGSSPPAPVAPVASAAAGASQLAHAAVTEGPHSAAPPAEQWWTPPPSGARQRVEVLAYGFSGIDERDLGAAFTADLQPIAGAPHVFEERAPRHARRNEVDKHLLRRWDGSNLDAGIRFLFVGFGSASRTDHDHTVFHSREVEEIVSLDESSHMRQPPPSAVFYLSAVHLGSCVTSSSTATTPRPGRSCRSCSAADRRRSAASTPRESTSSTSAGSAYATSSAMASGP